MRLYFSSFFNTVLIKRCSKRSRLVARRRRYKFFIPWYMSRIDFVVQKPAQNLGVSFIDLFLLAIIAQGHTLCILMAMSAFRIQKFSFFKNEILRL